MSTTSVSRSNRASRSLTAASLAAALVIWSQVGMAQLGGPFARFSGSWRGSGQVVGANGHREQIQCRAGYLLSKKGAAIAETLACASDSYQFDFNSDVVAVGHSVQGHWREATHQARGSLTGWIADGQFRGSVVGSNFTAAVSLKSNGSKQILYIRASGGDIAIVDVVLARSDV